MLLRGWLNRCRCWRVTLLSRKSQKSDVLDLPVASDLPTGTDDQIARIPWRCFGRSVRGAAHQVSGLPNQDALGWRPEGGEGRAVIAAVSDGHGSAPHFRSEVGARLAVEAALAVLTPLLEQEQTLAEPTLIKREAEERLPKELVRRWTAAVRAHQGEHGFREEELEHLEVRKGRAAREAAVRDPLLAYGATLLAFLATDAYLLCLQLGDGDFLFLDATGEVTRPLPNEEQLFGNATTSLCREHAWRDVRVRFQLLSGVKPPTLVILATDGYSNSFARESFEQVNADLLAWLRHEGPEPVEQGLADWLAEISEAGSGDDLTLTLLYRPAELARAETDDRRETPP